MNRGRLPFPTFDLRQPHAHRALVAALAVVLVLFGFDVIQYATLVIKTPWQLDFSDFYFAARTGLTHGWGQMYNTALSMPALYAATGNWFPFQHTPVFAWLLAPLSLLPYPIALTVWDGFLIGCFLLCWRLLAPGSAGRRLILLAAGLALYPVALGLALGQPTFVVLAGVSLSCWLLHRDRPLLAAAALALIAVKPQASFLVPVALLFAGRVRVFAYWTLFTMALAGLSVLALGFQGLHDWQHAIAIAYQLPGIRFNSAGSVIGAGPLATAVNVTAAGVALLIARLAAREGSELPIAAGLSGSVLATPYLSVHDLSALLIAAWLILRLDPPGWLKALMVVAYLPFFFANALFIHGPFLLLECAWLVALLAFAINRRHGGALAAARRTDIAA
ncbi:MAG TPA: glycosyltransferase family 87 protein [Gemmataceae bacterium]|nr:glycosyltransferase family 87 protein [Gemmataceae bacterium]